MKKVNAVVLTLCLLTACSAPLSNNIEPSDAAITPPDESLVSVAAESAAPTFPVPVRGLPIRALPVPYPEYEGAPVDHVFFSFGCQAIWLDAETLLCFERFRFKDGSIVQQIYYTASAPDFEPIELFRETLPTPTSSGAMYDVSAFDFQRIQGGYATVIGGDIIRLDANGHKRDMIHSLSAFSSLGSLLDMALSYDGKQMLLCTYDGLKQVDLETGAVTQVEDGVYEKDPPHVHEEGDCTCGPDFDYFGPLDVAYSHNGSLFACQRQSMFGEQIGLLSVYTREREIVYTCEDVVWYQWFDTENVLGFLTEDENEAQTLHVIDLADSTTMDYTLPFRYDRYENPIFLKDRHSLIYGLGTVLDLETGQSTNAIQPLTAYNDTGLLVASQSSQYVIREFARTEDTDRHCFPIPLP